MASPYSWRTKWFTPRRFQALSSSGYATVSSLRCRAWAVGSLRAPASRARIMSRSPSDTSPTRAFAFSSACQNSFADWADRACPYHARAKLSSSAAALRKRSWPSAARSFSVRSRPAR
jgi:hypothetical protein